MVNFGCAAFIASFAGNLHSRFSGFGVVAVRDCVIGPLFQDPVLIIHRNGEGPRFAVIGITAGADFHIRVLDLSGRDRIQGHQSVTVYF